MGISNLWSLSSLVGLFHGKSSDFFRLWKHPRAFFSEHPIVMIVFAVVSCPILARSRSNVWRWIFTRKTTQNPPVDDHFTELNMGSLGIFRVNLHIQPKTMQAMLKTLCRPFWSWVENWFPNSWIVILPNKGYSATPFFVKVTNFRFISDTSEVFPSLFRWFFTWLIPPNHSNKISYSHLGFA
jgi:hypothetical protein